MTSKELSERCFDDTVQSIWNFHHLLTEKKVPPSYVGRDKLLDIAIRICQMMADSLNAELGSSSHAPDFNIFSLCTRYRSLLRRLQGEILDYITSVDLSDIPFEIVEPLESFIRQFEQDFALILRCYSQENYQLTAHENLYGSYFETLSPYAPEEYRSYPSAPRWLVFISFPRIYSKNVLLHCITFSHELLHLRDHIDGISGSLLGQVQVSKSDISELVDQIATTPVFPEKPLLPTITIEEVRSREDIEREVLERCSGILERWLKELVADVLATRIFGPAYFFSLSRLSLSLGTMDQHSDSHPCARLRLRLMLEELHNMRYFISTKKDEVTLEELQKWEAFVREEVPPRGTPFHRIASSKILATAPTLKDRVRAVTKTESYIAAMFHREVPRLVELLNNGISPIEIRDTNKRIAKPATVVSILNAGYVFLYGHMNHLCQMLGIPDENDPKVVNKLGELLLHAILASTIWQRWLALQGREQVEAQKQVGNYTSRRSRGVHDGKGGVLSEEALIERIFCRRVQEQLIVTPQLEILPQDGTIDIHLGTKFLLFRKTHYPLIDPLTITDQKARELLEALQLRLDQPLNLHPGQLLLACTLEYISLPPDIGASVVTRSTYGRLGLVTATSVYVHPGFKGCLTLELVNIGNSPIVLRPCERVAQLVFSYHLPDRSPSHTKYMLATEPQFPKVWEERDRDLLNQLRSSSS